MPEGDTLLKIAEALRPALVGRALTRVALHHRRRPSLEVEVREVRSLGKHLLIELVTAEALRVHLGMWGSWHRYRHGEPWRKPRRRASVELETADAVFVCFNAKEVECAPMGKLDLRALARLGPDLLQTDVTPEALAQRARRQLSPEAPVVDALLDQRICAGIGNVFKNEALFLEGIDPRTRLGVVGDHELSRLYGTCRRLMEGNLGPWMRTTTWERQEGDRETGLPRHWVYGRAGERCLRCRSRIEHRRFGRGRRDTYWCPGCQETNVVDSVGRGAENDRRSRSFPDESTP